MRRREFLTGLAFAPLAAAPRRALFSLPDEPTVTVVWDTTAARPVNTEEVLGTLAPWNEWTRQNAPIFVPRITSPSGSSVTGWACSRLGGMGLCVSNTSPHAIRLRLEEHLSPGLWRTEAALVQTQQNAKVVRMWRMESVLRPSAAGMTVKYLPLPPEQTLFLRTMETLSEAQSAFRAVQAQNTGESVTTYSGVSVPGALVRIGAVVGTLPVLAVRNNRREIVKRVHRALLMTAQAEAMAQNAQNATLADRDVVFDRLTTALSEVSCAAYNLVPRQVLEAEQDGTPILRLSLTNGGSRTAPLVSLGGESDEGSGARTPRAVFRNVAPGATVSARLRLPQSGAPAAASFRGMVQVIESMGAAVFAAQPAGPRENREEPEDT